MTSENAALVVFAVGRDFCGLNLCLQLRGDCVEGIKRANKPAALSCFCFCYVIDSVHILLFAIAQVMNCFTPCLYTALCWYLFLFVSGSIVRCMYACLRWCVCVRASDLQFLNGKKRKKYINFHLNRFSFKQYQM